MCRYHLDVCPYPHHDPIASTVLDFAKYGGWKLCDDPRPWGRLSCGNLSIHHTLQPSNPRTISSDLEDSLNRSQSRSRHNSYPHTPIPNITNMNTSESPPDYSSLSDAATSAATPPSVTFSSATTLENHQKLIDISPLLWAKCEWCTIVLKAVSYKSIAIQEEAKTKMETMENTWDQEVELRALHEDIAEKEKQLDWLRQRAWSLANKSIVAKRPN